MLLARLVTGRYGDRYIDDRYSTSYAASTKPSWFVRLVAAVFGRKLPA
jgi:hypothetical protein